MSAHLTHGCDDIIAAELAAGRNIVIVPAANDEWLSEKRRVDYHEYRKSSLQWLLHFGENPVRATGYSPYTVYGTGYRAAAFDRWLWGRHDGYRLPPSTDDADAYVKETAYSDKSQPTKGKIEEVLLRYFRWLAHDQGVDEWNPNVSFESRGTSQPRDFLTVEERRKIRQAALDRGSIPNYNALTPTQRQRWQSHIADVLEKPVYKVTPDDWEAVESWKLTSMVWASLDAGLRPVEVGRAETSWVDIDNQVSRIPKEGFSQEPGQLARLPCWTHRHRVRSMAR